MGKTRQTSEKHAPARHTAAGAKPAPSDGAEPEWADGLRKLYDSVVDEPLPDSFKSLLDKLDDNPEEGTR